jgi:DsbC/DsbD-like thiol-disulfide interchange protein
MKKTMGARAKSIPGFERARLQPCRYGTQKSWALAPEGCPFLIHALALFLLSLAFQAVHAQSSLPPLTSRPIIKRESVEFLSPSRVTVKANKAAEVELHFRIEEGLHINSHTPKLEFLIPTDLSIPEDSGVRLESAIYPPGEEFVQPADPSMKLNVYTGEFVIQARLIAAPGDHPIQAKLRYQACDKNVCLPPKTITASIDVVAR